MQERKVWAVLFFLGAQLVVWFLVVNQLRIEWTINPQYQFGWGVPLLAGYLLLERWRSRPGAEVAGHRGWIRFLGLLVCLAYGVTRLVQEANPDWRLVGWALALEACGLSMFFFFRVGGFPWLKHFWFPFFFFLSGVPWPSWLEQPLTQALMERNAAVAVEILSWFGLAARQAGNLVIIPSGAIGVDQACSGLRSLQATLMGALFFGEFFRLSFLQRMGLLAMGVGLAVIGNLVRIFFLVWLETDGRSSLSLWHDPAGFGVLIFCLGMICAVAWKLRSRKIPPASSVSPDCWPSLRFSGAVIVALLACEGGTEWWYRSHETGEQFSSRISILWPTGEPGFRWISLPERETRILRYSNAAAAEWSDESGNRWSVFQAHWAPGRASVQLAHGHTPSACLPAVGCPLLHDFGIEKMAWKENEIYFQFYEFQSDNDSLFVFYTLMEDRMGRSSFSNDLGRWQLVRNGIRPQGQQVLEVALRGPSNSDQARNQLIQGIRQMVAFTRVRRSQ